MRPRRERAVREARRFDRLFDRFIGMTVRHPLRVTVSATGERTVEVESRCDPEMRCRLCPDAEQGECHWILLYGLVFFFVKKRN